MDISLPSICLVCLLHKTELVDVFEKRNDCGKIKDLISKHLWFEVSFIFKKYYKYFSYLIYFKLSAIRVTSPKYVYYASQF